MTHEENTVVVFLSLLSVFVLCFSSLRLALYIIFVMYQCFLYVIHQVKIQEEEEPAKVRQTTQFRHRGAFPMIMQY